MLYKRAYQGQTLIFHTPNTSRLQTTTVLITFCFAKANTLIDIFFSQLSSSEWKSFQLILAPLKSHQSWTTAVEKELVRCWRFEIVEKKFVELNFIIDNILSSINSFSQPRKETWSIAR